MFVNKKKGRFCKNAPSFVLWGKGKKMGFVFAYVNNYYYLRHPTLEGNPSKVRSHYSANYNLLPNNLKLCEHI